MLVVTDKCWCNWKHEGSLSEKISSVQIRIAVSEKPEAIRVYLITRLLFVDIMSSL